MFDGTPFYKFTKKNNSSAFRIKWGLNGIFKIQSLYFTLRSAQEVAGYHFQATDGEIAQVEDFYIDDQVWTLNYIVVDTRNWLPGRKVIVSPQWTSVVSWSERKVFFDLSREKKENSPEYNPAEPPDRKYEGLLYD
jgi:hypothetical protein